MSCHCVISANDADTVKAICQEIRTARKPKICTECAEVIVVGQQYEYFFGIYDGDRYHYRTCLPCVNIRSFFSCDGSWMWGCVWDDLEEHMFPEFHHGCLEPGNEEKDPLSVAAKNKVVNRWRKWKGLDKEANHG